MRSTTSSGPGGSARPRDLLAGAGRRRLDAQLRVEALRVDVEGVLSHPRRVPGRVVEGGEVVVVELDLGALHHPVAEADEDVLDLAHGPDQQVARADRRGGRARAGSRRPRRRRSPCSSSAASSSARRASSDASSASRASLPADADRPALLGRELGDPAQDPGQLGLSPQVANPELLERRGVGGRGDRGLGLRCEARSILPWTSGMAGHPMSRARGAPPRPPSRR